MPPVKPDLGERDVATVTPAGESVLKTIDGVETRSPVIHVDHRGALFEVYNGDPDEWREPVVYIYQTSVFPGQLKGWACHEKKIDRYTISSGELLVLLYDARADSPTNGVLQRVGLSARAVTQLRIPVGVWHLIINLGDVEAQLVNLPTERYQHDKPDRILLPWDTTEIPVDVRSYLRKF